MSDILIIFFLIVVVVAHATYMYYSYINLSDSVARKIEIIGYITLFILIIWEFIVKGIMLDDFYNDNWFFLDQKLSCIFRGIKSLHDGSSFNATNTLAYFTEQKTSALAQSQMFTVDVIQAILQIISTVCIAIGRFQDLKNSTNAARLGEESTFHSEEINHDNS